MCKYSYALNCIAGVYDPAQTHSGNVQMRWNCFAGLFIASRCQCRLVFPYGRHCDFFTIRVRKSWIIFIWNRPGVSYDNTRRCQRLFFRRALKQLAETPATDDGSYFEGSRMGGCSCFHSENSRKFLGVLFLACWWVEWCFKMVGTICVINYTNSIFRLLYEQYSLVSALLRTRKHYCTICS